MNKWFKALAWIAGVLIVLVGAARIFFVKTWRVPEDSTLAASIEPTLRGGDLVLVLHSGTREVGDLVRCPHPEQPNRWIIGRIYGVAGDKVQVKGRFVDVSGRLYRTTEACVEDKVKVTSPSGETNDLACQRLEFAGGWHYMASKGNEVDESNQQTVDAGKYYLVSDNRADYWDSRDFGEVPANTCTEKVIFRMWRKSGFFGEAGRFEYIR